MQKKKFKGLVNLEMSRAMQDVVNMTANLLAFVISLVISFFISPYIVKNLGAEANGFVTLANNFVSYAALIKTALNAIGSRFIIVAFHQGDVKKANKYYSSLFYGDLILSIVFSFLSIICIWQLEHLINISDNLVTDVKILFSFIFANFIFSTAATVFNSAPYIKNKIYLQSIRDIQSSLIRAVLLVVLFSLFEPKIFFLGIASFIPGIVVILYNIYYKSQLVPELKVKRTDFSWSTIKELVSQGVWNSVSSVGTLLLTSLDLLIANLFISEADMGILSVAKGMPNVISGLAGTLGGVFFSAMTIDYASGDTNKFIKTIKQSTLMTEFLMTIPLSFLIIYGKEFYTLWQPTLDAEQLQVLSILTCMGFILYAGANVVSSIFTITLHVKESSISVLVSGLISITVTLVLVKFTNLGVYAVAGVSSVVTVIRILGYTVPYSAKFIGKKKSTFMFIILKSLTSTIVLCGLGFLMKLIIPFNSWFDMILSAAIFSVLSLVLNMFVVLDKETRTVFIGLVKSKLKKGN